MAPKIRSRGIAFLMSYAAKPEGLRYALKHMMMEYEGVWPYLRPQGLLLSNDIYANGAFFEFCNQVDGKVFASRTLSLGAIVKN
jgi:hypothetical protein